MESNIDYESLGWKYAGYSKFNKYIKGNYRLHIWDQVEYSDKGTYIGIYNIANANLPSFHGYILNTKQLEDKMKELNICQ